MTKEKQLEILNFCAKDNKPEFNKDKILEELIELSEVILKRQTKHDDNPKKPAKEELIKEFGDVFYRGIIYLKQEFSDLSIEEIDGKVTQHIFSKLEKLHEYRSEGKYKKGL